LECKLKGPATPRCLLLLHHAPASGAAVAALERARPALSRHPAGERAGHAVAAPDRAHGAAAADGAGQAVVGADAAAGNRDRRTRGAGAAVVADGDARPLAVETAASAATAARSLCTRRRFLALLGLRRIEGAGEALVLLADVAAGRALRQRGGRAASHRSGKKGERAQMQTLHDTPPNPEPLPH